MLNLTKNQIIIFILIVLFVLANSCKEYFGGVNCSDIRGETPEGCEAMTLDQCQNWASNMGKNFQPNNDVFCGVVDNCPVGCYVHNGDVYFGSSTNIGECSNQRICVKNTI